MNRDQDLDLLLNAYLDSELDPAEAAAFEQRLAADPATAAAFESLAALGRRLRSERAGDLPPPELRQQLDAAVGLASGPARTHWGMMAASLVAGVALGAVVAWSVGPTQRANSLANTILASHIRGMMATAPVDVASSDKHTVKPWFDGKLSFAPNVVDLADQGFPLVGGRIEMVDLQPVAALVYRRNQHVITLTEIPGGATLAAPTSERGFLLRSWQVGGLAYWAVSDVGGEDLDAFVRLFRASATEAGP